MHLISYFVFLGLLWIQFFVALIPSWQDGTYYEYGWLVPAAMVFFFLRRRAERQGPGHAPEAASGRVLPIVLGSLALLLFALRIIEGGNVHWRLPLWIHGSVVVILTAFAMRAVEGEGAVSHYLPVLTFTFVALPLPSFLEQSLVADLTAAVTTTGADLARLAGLPVVIAEAAFLVDVQALDVNDGCSGIRSFQSCLMAGLFVGELLRLSLPSRITLMLVAMASAFVGNTFRVLLLVHAFADEGTEGVSAVSDPDPGLKEKTTAPS